VKKGFHQARWDKRAIKTSEYEASGQGTSWVKKKNIETGKADGQLCRTGKDMHQGKKVPDRRGKGDVGLGNPGPCLQPKVGNKGTTGGGAKKERYETAGLSEVGTPVQASVSSGVGAEKLWFKSENQRKKVSSDEPLRGLSGHTV